MRLFKSYSQIFPIYCPCIRRYDDLYTGKKVWNRKQQKIKNKSDCDFLINTANN
jgi:hypothetical protein